MAEKLTCLLLDPESRRRALEGTERYRECARACGLDPEKACRFICTLVEEGLVTAHTRKKHSRRAMVSDSESESESELESESEMERVLKGSIDGRDCFVKPYEFYKSDANSVKRGVWYYTRADLEELPDLKCFTDQLKLALEGDNETFAVLKSNHEQSFQKGDLVCGDEAWTWVEVCDLGFVDVDNNEVMAINMDHPFLRRAQLRIKAEGVLNIVLSRGLGRHTSEWKTLMESLDQQEDTLIFHEEDSNAAKCGACGQKKALSYRLQLTGPAEEHLRPFMCHLGSFCGSLLMQAPVLAGFAYKNQYTPEEVKEALSSVQDLVSEEDY